VSLVKEKATTKGTKGTKNTKKDSEVQSGRAASLAFFQPCFESISKSSKIFVVIPPHVRLSQESPRPLGGEGQGEGARLQVTERADRCGPAQLPAQTDQRPPFALYSTASLVNGRHGV
jgi:hypothetical protein